MLVTASLASYHVVTSCSVWYHHKVALPVIAIPMAGRISSSVLSLRILQYLSKLIIHTSACFSSNFGIYSLIRLHGSLICGAAGAVGACTGGAGGTGAGAGGSRGTGAGAKGAGGPGACTGGAVGTCIGN